MFRDMNKILTYLPSNSDSTSINSRQTLLFSATFSNEIKEIANSFLRKGFSIVDTVGEEVEQTHSHVSQKVLSVPISK